METHYSVISPRTPGAQPTETKHKTLGQAYKEARTFNGRKDLVGQDVMITKTSPKGRFCVDRFAGPCR